jgi:carotenoid cleavage dioxygenase-like enzyme
VVSKDGVMQDEVTITVSGPVMMHDFAITEHYAIFMDMPLYFNPKVGKYTLLFFHLFQHFFTFYVTSICA